MRFLILFLGGRFQSQEPNIQNWKKKLDTFTRIVCWNVHTSVVWLLESATGTHRLSAQVYTHVLDRDEKHLKNQFWYRTLVLNFFEKTNFLIFGSLLVLSWKLSVLWCFWNNWNRQISDSDFLLKILEGTYSLILNILKNQDYHWLLKKSNNRTTLLHTLCSTFKPWGMNAHPLPWVWEKLNYLITQEKNWQVWCKS
jgi:hypothetical protein